MTIRVQIIETIVWLYGESMNDDVLALADQAYNEAHPDD